jgi:hypothetical protein
MKNILKTLCLLLFTIHFSCKAQNVPLKTYDYVNGSYLKDLDNVLPFWVGTWKGTVNNKEYTFQFVKFPQHLTTFSNGDYYYEDVLKAKFKVVDLGSNTILYDNLNANTFEEYKIYFLDNILTEYFFYFTDNETNCYNSAKFTLLKSNTNLNLIEFKDFSYGDNINLDCPYANQIDIPIYLPKVNLTLTRQ